jgi:hypothetical protein
MGFGKLIMVVKMTGYIKANSFEKENFIVMIYEIRDFFNF